MKKETADKLLILILLLCNGNNPFYNFNYLFPTSLANFIWIFIVLIFYYKFKKNIPIKNSLLIYVFTGIVLLIFQKFKIASPVIGRTLGFFFLPLLAYLIVNFIEAKSLRLFPIIFKKIIIFSLIIWIPSALLEFSGINIANFIPSYMLTADNSGNLEFTHIIIYNFRSIWNNVYFIFRNSAFYWEPGAFAGNIVMIYLIFILQNKTYTRYVKNNIHFWLIVGLISTFSTTGLILLPFLVFLNNLYNKSENVIKVLKQLIIILPIIIVASYLIFNYVPTVGDKIILQFENVVTNKAGSNSTRLGSILFLLVLILKSPFIGNGIFTSLDTWDKLLYHLNFNSDHSIGNGMFLYIAQAGIPFFVIICTLWFKTFKNLTGSTFFSFLFIFVILILLQGEAWLNYPFLFAFMFFKTKTDDFKYNYPNT